MNSCGLAKSHLHSIWHVRSTYFWVYACVRTRVIMYWHGSICPGVQLVSFSLHMCVCVWICVCMCMSEHAHVYGVGGGVERFRICAPVWHSDFDVIISEMASKNAAMNFVVSFCQPVHMQHCGNCGMSSCGIWFGSVTKFFKYISSFS